MGTRGWMVVVMLCLAACVLAPTATTDAGLEVARPDGGTGGGGGSGGTGGGCGGGGAYYGGPTGSFVESVTSGTNRHLRVVRVVQGAYCSSRTLTAGDVRDVNAHFSADATAIVFSRLSADGSAPTSLRVVNMDGGSDRELATCRGTGDPVHAADGYVYFVDRASVAGDAGASMATLSRVSWSGGTVERLSSLPASCDLALSLNLERTRLAIHARGAGCGAPGTSVTALPPPDAGLTQLVLTPPVGVTFVPPVVLGSAEQVLVFGLESLDGGVAKRLYSWDTAQGTPSVVFELDDDQSIPEAFFFHRDNAFVTDLPAAMEPWAVKARIRPFSGVELGGVVTDWWPY